MNNVLMIEQQDEFWWYKLNGALRLFIVKGGFRFFFKNIIINEYPKSGGTWIGQMLSKTTGMPFPQNRLPILGSCIMHGHYYSAFGINNVLIVWRDGRDVIISQYYHWLFENDRGNASLVKKCREDLQFDDYEDITTNLPKFIDYVYMRKIHPKFSWSDFVNQWIQRDVVFIKYESMRFEPVSELIRITKSLSGMEIDENFASNIVTLYSFEKQSGRKDGEENINSFMRKGIVGDWKNHFSDEAIDTFKKYAGHQLIALGYENDLNW